MGRGLEWRLRSRGLGLGEAPTPAGPWAGVDLGLEPSPGVRQASGLDGKSGLGHEGCDGDGWSDPGPPRSELH